MPDGCKRRCPAKPGTANVRRTGKHQILQPKHIARSAHHLGPDLLCRPARRDLHHHGQRQEELRRLLNASAAPFRPTPRAARWIACLQLLGRRVKRYSAHHPHRPARRGNSRCRKRRDGFLRLCGPWRSAASYANHTPGIFFPDQWPDAIRFVNALPSTHGPAQFGRPRRPGFSSATHQ